MKKTKQLIALFCLTVILTNQLYAQWTAQTSGTTQGLSSVFFTNKNIGYVVGDGGTILKTINGGANWNALTSGTTNYLYSTYFTNTNIGYVVGTNGLILKTINGGTDWTTQTSGTTNYLNSVYFINSDTGYVVGASGTILKTTNGGTNWVAQTSGTTNPLTSICFTDANTGYIAGGVTTGGAIILKTINGGGSWTSQYTNGTAYLNSICFFSKGTPNMGYAVGGLNIGGAKILKTINGGTNWISQPVGTIGNLKCVYFTDANTGYLIGYSGKIYKTINGGTDWIPLTSGTNEHLYSINFTSTDTGYVVGNTGTILKTINGGIAPAAIIKQPEIQLKRFGANASFKVSAVGTSPVTYKWKKNGVVIPNKTDSILNLNTVGFADEGFYTCEVSNAIRTVVSDSAELMIADNFEIVGDTVVLNVTNAVGTIQWQKSDDSLVWTDMTSATTNPYSFVSTSSLSSRRCYRAKVSDPLCTLASPVYSSIIRNKIYSSVSKTPVSLYYHGSIIFYNDGAGNGLMAPTQDQSSGVIWGCKGNSIPAATSDDDGTMNTSAILSACSAQPIAASICDTLTINNFNDWYLPAINELKLLYQKKSQVGSFIAEYYWSSTEIDNNRAWTLSLYNGAQYSYDKIYYPPVRCIRKFSSSDIFKTYCTATVTNQPVTVNVSAQPVMQVKHYGNTATFIIAVTGNKPITYKWKKNGATIPNETDSILKIKNIAFADEGYYSCEVSNLCRTIVSDSAELIIADNIEIVGDSVVLNVKNAVGTIQWQQTSDTLVWIDIAGATSNPFSFISTSTLSRKRYYRAKVNDPLCPNATPVYSSVIRNKVLGNYSEVPVGAYFHGGVTFYNDGSGHGLIAPQQDQGVGYTIWGCEGISIPGATSLTDGAVNTSAIVAGCAVRPIAACLCDSLNLNNYNDWFLPAKDQLNYLFQQHKNVGGFAEYGGYWSSSEHNSGNAFLQNIGNGSQFDVTKDYTCYVRCVRKYSSHEKTYCTATVTNQPVTVNILVQPIAQIKCKSSRVTFVVTANGTSPYQYLWKKDNTNIENATDSSYTISSVSVADEGNYSCEVTNLCRSKLSNSAELKVVELTANAGADKYICGGKNSLLNGIIGTNHTEFGTPSFTWSPTNTLLNTNSLTPTAQPLSNTNYTLSVTDINNCSISDQVLVDVTNLAIDAGTDKTIICDGTAQLDNVNSNYTGTGNLTYKWTPATGLNYDSISNPKATITTDTKYIVTVTTPIGCIAKDSVYVNIKPLTVNTGLGKSIICGGKVQFNYPITNYTGSGILSYSWLPKEGLDSAKLARPTAEIISDKIYTLSVSTPNGCLAKDSVKVIVNPLTVNAGADKSIICGGKVQFDNPITNYTGSGILSYSWLPAEGLDSAKLARPTAEIILDKIYTLSVSTPNGCFAKDSIRVTVNPLEAYASNVTVSCGNTAQLNVASNYTGVGILSYSWSPSDSLNAIDISNPIVHVIKPADYTVEITTPNGCKASKVVSVNISVINIKPAICMVTVDSLNRNVVIWEKPNAIYNAIASYNIYKESTSSGIYNKIGNVNYNKYSIFIDTNSRPMIQSDRYKISVNDVCGFESSVSPFHRTLHLSVSPNGAGKGYQLNWQDSYEGFTFYTYYIFRGTNKFDFVKIDSIQNNLTSRTDTTSMTGQIFYVVAAVKPDGACWPSGNNSKGVFPVDFKGANFSTSNIFDLNFDGIKESLLKNIQIYPNPMNDKFTVELDYNYQKESYNLEVLNTIGQVVVAKKLFNRIEQIDLKGQSAGVYFVKIQSANSTIVKKIIKQE